MPALALSRVGVHMVESGPARQDLAAGAWQRLEALPDPRSRQGRIYPLACLMCDRGLCVHRGSVHRGRGDRAERPPGS
jgi:hypothetical protein